ncbi:MAG TPA: hypothetical protein VHL57_06690 [Flavobacteriales bacterium]|jgi:hypothetical protein|nr:hypothetical protein [Flavobacteriales bacterium]
MIERHRSGAQRAGLVAALLFPLLLHAQQERTEHRVQPWLHVMLGDKLPAGFFGIGSVVEFRPWLIPSVMFGLGGGPDGATIALGNEACLFRSGWFEARAFGYWANAFGRDEQDEFSQGYRTLTESSRSLKLGGAIGVYTSKDLCFAVRAGYSWALNVPLVTKETPTGTSTQPSDDPYFSDGLLFGLSMCARL